MSRAEVLPKCTIVGDINPRSSMSVEQYRSPVISRRNGGYDEPLSALEEKHWKLDNVIQRAKVIVSGSKGERPNSEIPQKASR